MTAGRVRPSLLRLIEAMEGIPALIRNARTDVLAANRLGRALHPHLFSGPSRQPNLARFVFLDPRAPDFYGSWEQSARDCVAVLRLASGSHADDAQLFELVGELSARSIPFSRLWSQRDLRRRTTGEKTLHLPEVGELTLAFETLATSDGDTTLVAYTVSPGGASAQTLALLGSWSAPTRSQEDHG